MKKSNFLSFWSKRPKNIILPIAPLAKICGSKRKTNKKIFAGGQIFFYLCVLEISVLTIIFIW